MPRDLSNPAIEELVRDRQLNLHMLARWRKYLRESKASGEPVFRLWHAAAAIPDKEFAAQLAGRAGPQPGSRPLIEAEVRCESLAPR